MWSLCHDIQQQGESDYYPFIVKETIVRPVALTLMQCSILNIGNSVVFIINIFCVVRPWPLFYLVLSLSKEHVDDVLGIRTHGSTPLCYLLNYRHLIGKKWLSNFVISRPSITMQNFDKNSRKFLPQLISLSWLVKFCKNWGNQEPMTSTNLRVSKHSSEEIKHSDWLLQVLWLVLLNQSELFLHSVATLL